MSSMLTPQTPTRAAKRLETSRRLMRCALELCDERGFDGWTIDDLAERAEVSRRTVFNYYDGKADVVLGPEPEVSDESRDRFVAKGPHGRLIADLLVLADEVFEEQVPDPEAMVLSRQVVSRDPQLLALVHDRFESITERFVDYVRQREGASYDEDRARLLIRMLVAICDTAVDRARNEPTRPFAELFAEAVDDARALLTD